MNIISWLCILTIAGSFAFVLEEVAKLAFHLPKHQRCLRLMAMTVLSAFVLFLFMTWRYPRDPYVLIARKQCLTYLENVLREEQEVNHGKNQQRHPYFCLRFKKHVLGNNLQGGSILFQCLWANPEGRTSILHVDYQITSSNTVFEVKGKE